MEASRAAAGISNGGSNDPRRRPSDVILGFDANRENAQYVSTMGVSYRGERLRAANEARELAAKQKARGSSVYMGEDTRSYERSSDAVIGSNRDGTLASQSHAMRASQREVECKKGELQGSSVTIGFASHDRLSTSDLSSKSYEPYDKDPEKTGAGEKFRASLISRPAAGLTSKDHRSRSWVSGHDAVGWQSTSMAAYTGQQTDTRRAERNDREASWTLGSGKAEYRSTSQVSFCNIGKKAKRLPPSGEALTTSCYFGNPEERDIATTSLGSKFYRPVTNGELK